MVRNEERKEMKETGKRCTLVALADRGTPCRHRATVSPSPLLSHGALRLMVGLEDLRGLFRAKRFYDFQK